MADDSEQNRQEETRDRRDSAGQGSEAPRPDWRPYLWIVLLMGLGFYWMDYARDAAVHQLSYTQFKAAAREGEVESVTLRGQEIRGKFTESAPQPGAQEGKGRTFTTVRPPVDDPQLMSLLEEKDVSITARSTQAEWWQRLLITMLPWVIIFGVLIYISQRMQQRMAGGGQGGLFGFGCSRARRFREESTGVTMNDVAGSDNAKTDLQEIIDYLRDPMRYRRLGAQIPRGVLLMGAPGTGKTLLAKAVAGEASVPFYSISGSEFIEMFVGVGAARVRDMFRDARRESPSIVFIDELDSIGRSRGTGLGGGHDEREQTLNQILSEMDGFEAEETVVVMAATNRPDVLDPALLRPGRFDRKITIDRPHREARRAILDVHCRDKPLADDVDLDKVAERTVGFAGADLSNLVNEAALLAGRDNKRSIDMECFDSARDKIVLGERREEHITEEDRRVIAYHESGHTLMAWLLPHADPPDKVTIIPRGQALGATEQHMGEERYNMTESYLRDRIGVMLGGRSAEKLIFGEVSTGAQQDLRQATDLVRKMVAEWGMSSRLGAAAFPRGESQPFLGREMAQPPNFSEQTAEVVDAEIRRILDEIDQRIDKMLEENRERLEELAQRLLKDETLHSRDIEAVFSEAA